ncbi:hypothetical protein ACFFX0_30035 [Citricoccus parietis]|uniref:Uncharacterized protein n=1 Tax=Citricoccus parietis TaxID=592307 RepID=A0ABV5G8H3_9MICC
MPADDDRIGGLGAFQPRYRPAGRAQQDEARRLRGRRFRPRSHGSGQCEYQYWEQMLHRDDPCSTIALLRPGRCLGRTDRIKPEEAGFRSANGPAPMVRPGRRARCPWDSRWCGCGNNAPWHGADRWSAPRAHGTPASRSAAKD